jgi:hypothetical protein
MEHQTFFKVIDFCGRVENYHAGVEIDDRRIAKNVDIDVDQYFTYFTYFLYIAMSM